MKMLHLEGVPPLYTNCFLLIGDEGHAVVIDPSADAAKIDAALKDNNATLTHVFLTHGHPDHTMTLKQVVAAHHPKICMNPADAKLFCVGYDEAFTDFGTITVDDMDFKIIFTPGHSKGSVILRVGDLLFTGDTLFAQSIGRTDLPGGSMGEMRQSLQKILDNVPDNPKIFPGHQGFSTMQAEREHNPYLQF